MARVFYLPDLDLVAKTFRTVNAPDFKYYFCDVINVISGVYSKHYAIADMYFENAIPLSEKDFDELMALHNEYLEKLTQKIHEYDRRRVQS